MKVGFEARMDTESPVDVEAEIRVLLPQAKECRGPSEAGRGKKGFFLRAIGGIVAPSTPDLGLLVSRNVRE